MLRRNVGETARNDASARTEGRRMPHTSLDHSYISFPTIKAARTTNRASILLETRLVPLRPRRTVLVSRFRHIACQCTVEIWALLRTRHT